MPKSLTEVSFVMLQTVLKQESTDHGSAELKLYADHLEQTAPLGRWRRESFSWPKMGGFNMF
jgi:hypothetical protein